MTDNLQIPDMKLTISVIDPGFLKIYSFGGLFFILPRIFPEVCLSPAAIFLNLLRGKLIAVELLK